MNNKNKSKNIIGLRFSSIGKEYYFDASKLEDLKIGEFVVVQTSRGWQIGQLTTFVDSGQHNKKMHYKPVDRIANEADLKKKQYLVKRSKEVLEFTRKRFSIQEIRGVKLVTADFSFDEKSLTFLYSTENDIHINFKSIQREIQNNFGSMKIDFHKIGPRDVAKYFCGMGACGLENRCCSQFMDKFQSISIRMAKKQGISLTPSDITGMCNRLRCCLSYEYPTYVEALKEMPRRKKRVKTPFGIGVVKDLAPISKTVYVSVPDHGVKEFDVEEIEEIDTSKQKQKNQQQTKRTNRNRPRNRRRPRKGSNSEKK